MANKSAFKRYSETQKTEVVETTKINPTKTSRTKKKTASSTPKTYKMLNAVLEDMEDKFYNERLKKKGMNYQKYINDLVYRDTHNGSPLYDYETGELLVDLD